MICSIPGCDKRARRRSWCDMHYRRWRVRGSVDSVRYMRSGSFTLEERLLAKTRLERPDFSDPLIRLEPDCEPCRIWTGERSRGYGRIHIKGKKWLTHVIAYLTFVGPIEPGNVLDHLCRRSACWAPTHLEPVTLVENLERGRNPHYRMLERANMNGDSND